MRRGKSNRARNSRISRHYANGHSLQETGTHFGITKQRVHQILKAYFPGVMRPANVNLRYEQTLEMIASTK